MIVGIGSGSSWCTSRDPNDRRRVIVRLAMRPEVERRVAGIFGPLSEATAELAASYSSKDLELILGFRRRATAISNAQLAKLRPEKAPTNL